MKIIAPLLVLLWCPPFDKQDDPIPDDAPAEYRKAMEAGRAAILKKDWAHAAKSFGDALRTKPADKLREMAERGFRTAIKNLEIYNARFGELKEKTIRNYCGDKSDDLKKTVEAGLKWLVKMQKEDGHWSSRGHGHMADDRATTALALMALLADGNSEITGPFKDNVQRALGWLLKHQRDDGGFSGASFYSEGIVVLCIVEAFVMGGTERAYEAAQKGINFIVKGQRKGGGWMYRVTDEPECDGDVSVTGNVFQVLKQGQMAYLDFDDASLGRTAKFIENATDENGWVYYRAYGGEKRHHKTFALTAIGNLIRLYSGKKLDEKGLQVVRDNRAEAKDNMYFMYFGTMLSFLAGGEAWSDWRDMMIPALMEKQVKEGDAAGSWKVEGALSLSGKGSNPLSEYLSDVDMSSLALLSLQACYRYVPAKMMPK